MGQASFGKHRDAPAALPDWGWEQKEWKFWGWENKLGEWQKSLTRMNQNTAVPPEWLHIPVSVPQW